MSLVPPHKSYYGRRLLAVLVFFIQLDMFTRHIHRPTIDEHLFDLGPEFQWVTVGKDEVRNLSLFEASHEFVDTEDLSRIDRDTFQCLFFG